ncbi:hypothetical protein A2U01_0100619, partial [Trifolium medium]|nr:hypothetical protein [Trifolium medium]
RMNLPQQVPHNTGIVDDAHARRYCRVRRAARQPREQPQAPPAGPSMDPTLQNWFYHTWDQNAANYRAMTAVHQSM